MNLVSNNDMDLRTLFDGFGVDVPQREIADISTESRNVSRDGLFLACRGGTHHGLDFIDQVLAVRPSAIAWEPDARVREPVLPPEVIAFAVPDLGHRLGDIANRFFATPSAALSVTGITGTNGKTTTAWLVTQALGKLGGSAGYMGTLGHGLGIELRPGVLTTPGCITLHRQLRELADAGARHAVLEVSSHALDQRRVDGVHFNIVAFSNLSRDHLDHHGDLQNYADAKARLFRTGAATAVINLDDPFGRTLAGSLPPATACLGVSLDGNPAARLRGRLLQIGADGLVLELGGDFGTAQLHSRLWGRFNAENLLLAAGILLAGGWPLGRVVPALAECTAPPGRMQLVPALPGQPAVLVDFAHTADALRKALQAVREHCTGQLWCVFGCGGNRDSGKRALMGSVAAELADRVIVTDDNPRDENSQQIIADILAGVDAGSPVQVIPDRAAAIQQAIHSAASGDVILIAGKGHEQTQIVAGVSRPFSDLAVAVAALSVAPQGPGT
jgi:UDP-N-acetylmuramoyl-L-alanyl-D-glutamate--2,6-diaminopimelate ligase